ncbi:MAG: 50S ribosomal protein L11 methyltransferase [Hyphomicrobiaceae bacterium]
MSNRRLISHDTVSHDAFVHTHTERVSPPLVPEITLLLAREPRGIFVSADTYCDGGLGARPYWAFAWPGGQALARYLLDNPDLVRGKSVLDIGAGSAMGAIAAMKAGAKLALAADIDHLAESAARLNATLNDVRIETTHDDLLSSPITWPTTWDVILIGDLVYEPDLKQRVGTFLEAARAKGAKVIYADRTTARRPAVDLRLLAEYEAPLTPPLVEDFIERARVWELGRH